MIRRVNKGPNGGRAWDSPKGWFYLGIGGEIYVFHLELGRFSLSIQASEETRANAKARRAARKAV